MVDTPDTLLEGDRLSRRFGGVVALQDYSVKLSKGDLLGLIGPNGAGKTTAFNLLSGVLPPSSGSISLDGRNLTGSQPEAFAEAGIARSFQNIRLFKDLSAWENVAAGYHMRHGAGWLSTILALPGARASERRMREKACALMETVGLADFIDQRAGDMPYGHQRKLEIARALATEPRVLLLDEPAAGMNATETEELKKMIAVIHEDLGLTLVLVEHDMRFVMSLCRRVQVLNRGELIADGTPEEVQATPAVAEAYLGKGRGKKVA
ncbi:ABC transporter ATP-binding protein [Fodinicurvata sediminis]|uniref:ABC transporter ATP-binding protein n=1 Tax=Fodinicurvata sediminis TaxID=1121832 RepID=UPI0003B6145B|nr:ABC transporter ATP-binding protein [Fodinicurvata sediminis]